MIIGFDASHAFTQKKTGTENYSYQLLKHLAAIDHKNTYLVYIRSRIKENFPKNFIFKVINWPRLWTQGGLAIETFKDNLDVLFVPAHTLPVIRRKGLKTVVTVHDLGSEYLPSMHQFKQRLYLGFMQRIQLQGADKIIAVSEATKKDLIQRADIAAEKIAVIYEGYNRSLFIPIKNDILVNTLNRFNLAKQEYFLFVGTVQPRKNLERVIKAFSALKGNFTLAIAGEKGWLNEEIYSLPEKLAISERVKFLGYVPEHDLPKLYSGAIGFVYPSLFEGFGLPILEAQACGCPVLTAGVSSMPEVAGKGAILVDPYSIDDITNGLKNLLVGKKRKQLIKAGLGNIKKFSWEKCAQETLQALENL